jgi:hypothetical protein
MAGVTEHGDELPVSAPKLGISSPDLQYGLIVTHSVSWCVTLWITFETGGVSNDVGNKTHMQYMK